MCSTKVLSEVAASGWEQISCVFNVRGRGYVLLTVTGVCVKLLGRISK